jgi:hypothetical protein
VRQRVGPVRHVGDGSEGEFEGSVGVGAAVLPPAEGGREEVALRAVGLGDDGGEPAVGEERVGGPADTDGVVVVGLVGEGTPLGGLVDGVRLQHEAALGAHRVPRRVVERHLRLLLAVPAEGVAHLARPAERRLCSRAAGGVLEEERGDLGGGEGEHRGGGAVEEEEAAEMEDSFGLGLYAFGLLRCFVGLRRGGRCFEIRDGWIDGRTGGPRRGCVRRDSGLVVRGSTHGRFLK